MEICNVRYFGLYLSLCKKANFKLQHYERKEIVRVFFEIFNHHNVKHALSDMCKRLTAIHKKKTRLCTHIIPVSDIKFEYTYTSNTNHFVINYKYGSKQATATMDLPHISNVDVHNPSYKSLLLYYHMLDLTTSHYVYAMPGYYAYIQSLYKTCIECFTSLHNRCLNDFYSLLPIEKDFGSHGEFKEKFPHDTYDCYVMNPPTLVQLIQNTIKLIFEKFKSYTFDVIMTIPYWEDTLISVIRECISPTTINYVGYHYDQFSVVSSENNLPIIAKDYPYCIIILSQKEIKGEIPLQLLKIMRVETYHELILR